MPGLAKGTPTDTLVTPPVTPLSRTRRDTWVTNAVIAVLAAACVGLALLVQHDESADRQFQRDLDTRLREHYALTVTRIPDLPDGTNQHAAVLGVLGTERTSTSCDVYVRDRADDLVVICGVDSDVVTAH